ncbi:MAG: ATP-binding protein [Salibacteraceae bacterium]
MDFKEIIGQTQVKAHLLDALKNGRIAHAQLFLGTPGSGSLPMALAYAELIVAHIKKGEWVDEPDESAILKSRKLVHPDIHFVFPVNKTENIKPKYPISNDFIELFRKKIGQNPYVNLNEWYNFIGMGNSQGLISVSESANILKKLSLKPYESDFKVMIIWMPEQMNIPASNKILKILEEPPAKTLFILASEDSDKLISTITSRCQLVKLDALTDSEIAQGLVDKTDINVESAKSIAHLSSGNFNRALELIKHGEAGNTNQEEFVTWMRLCFSKDVGELLKWGEKMARTNRENLKLFFEYALHMFRESLIMNYADDSLLRLEGSEKAFAKKFAPFINQANCVAMILEFETASANIQRNANAKILLFDLSIQVMKLIRVKPSN